MLWSAAEGHNDVFWLALVLLADRARGVPGRVAVLVAAVAVKAVAAVPLAAALVRLPPRRRRLAGAAAFAALAAAYAPLAWSVVAHGFDRGPGPPRLSLVTAPALAAWSGSPVPLAVGAVLAVAAVAAIARAVRGGDVVPGAVLAGWLLLPSPAPWYAIWLVPVVAASARTPASLALFAASFTGLAGYVQDAVGGTTLRDPALLGGTMLALYALPLLLALASPAPAPQPSPVAPPAPPLVTTPAPSPAATTTPAPPSPSPSPQASPSPQPSSSPALFNYVIAPSPGPAGAPRIVEIAINDRVLHRGGMVLVRVTTSPDVTGVIARTMGHEIAIPQGAPGYFAGQEQLPAGIPFFMLNRVYQIEFVATTSDGRSTTYSLPVRLDR